MQRSRVITAAVALAAVAGAALWWQSPGTDAGAPAQGLGALSAGASAAAAAGAAAPSGGAQGSAVTARRSAAQADASDPLLVQGLRDTLEALLLEAGDVSDPAALKQRLAALVAQHFPPDLATRALALAERYVDYRVALGALNGRAPQDLGDPRALRDALQARQQVRLQFFDSAEYDALFAREAELDRYTLARLEIARNTALTPEQRAQALQAADNALPAERRAERAAATEHMAAAAQTAAFDAQNASAYTRHQARSAQYGEAAAHALAQLDRDEQHWQQRLTQYSQARAQQGDQSATVQQLRQQLFTSDEQQRVEAALTLRKAGAQAAGS
ncbi:lipase secretion chaperone [Acidovorax sp. LjRoot194]|uniref:lipase secretion chaperone n=1 Tax=Acidovorax sp. LjRoot194 TaxID=3342280 RepID=UPI0010DC68EE|nr:MAG: lipase chaperone [Comamonadaceae bacterium]